MVATIDYSMYLYSNLLKLYDEDFKELEYDTQFKVLPDLYNEFKRSDFNHPDGGSEYECIINWLENQYNKDNE